MPDYIVQRGDTLGSIAAKKLGNENRWPEIARLNNIENPNQLFVGQRLKLPATTAANANVPPNTNQIPSTIATGPLATGPLTNQQSPATMALGSGYMFVVFEQLPDVGTGKVIRKVAVIPKNYGMLPPNPLANLSLADHVLGNNASQYLSASNKPFGAPTIQGKPLLIDLARTQAGGAQIHTVEEVIADLNRFANQNPASRTRVNQLIWAIKNVEGEVLIEGSVPGKAVTRLSTAHTPYINTADELWASFQKGSINKAQLEAELSALEKAYGKARIVGRVGRVITVVGVVFTVKDVADATQRSIDANSYKPLAAEAIRQVGGWGGAIAGAKIGAVVGAAVGIETGPGAIITGAIGAIVFGAAGYFGADFIADWVEEDAVNELRKDVRSTDNMQTKGITLIVLPGETQYDFARRALLRAAFNAGLFANYRQNGFADKFYPLSRNAEEKAKTKINWISGDPNSRDGSDMKPEEWERLRGKEFTYFLNEAEVKELINAILKGY